MKIVSDSVQLKTVVFCQTFSFSLFASGLCMKALFKGLFSVCHFLLAII